MENKPPSKRELKKRAVYSKRMAKRLSLIPWETTELITTKQSFTFENMIYHFHDDYSIQDFCLSTKDKTPILSVYSKGVKQGEEINKNERRLTFETFFVGFGPPKSQIYKKVQTVLVDMSYPRVDFGENWDYKNRFLRCLLLKLRLIIHDENHSKTLPFRI